MKKSLLMLVAALILASCPASAQAENVLTVALSEKNIKAAMIVLAQQLGYYQREGLTVKFESTPGMNEALVAIEQGKLDILPTGIIPSCTFIAQGSPVVIFGGTVSEGSECVVRPEGAEALSDFANWAGKTVACVRPETGHIVMEAQLREYGAQFVELDSFASVAEAVLKGEADIGFVNSGYGFIAQKRGLHKLFDVGQYAPDAVCCRQTTSRANLEDAQKRALLVKFEIATLEAYRTHLLKRDKCVGLLAAYSETEREFVEYCLYGGAMKISLDPEPARIEEFYEIMRANGDIAQDAPGLLASVDDTVYRDALQEMLRRYPDDPNLAALQERPSR